MLNQSIDSAKSKMEQTISFVSSEIGKIRTGRANPSILDDVKVDYYGNMTPINQTSNITIEEGRSLVTVSYTHLTLPTNREV